MEAGSRPGEGSTGPGQREVQGQDSGSAPSLAPTSPQEPGLGLGWDGEQVKHVSKVLPV